jgi:hypothetical protein
MGTRFLFYRRNRLLRATRSHVSAVTASPSRIGYADHGGYVGTRRQPCPPGESRREEVPVTKSAWITVGIALLLVWMLSFLVFKVAGLLIHLLLVVAGIAILIGLVRRVV